MQKTIFIFLLCAMLSQAQTKKHSDYSSENSNLETITNKERGQMASKKINILRSEKISDSIPETSGLLSFQNLLWTHNDDHDTTLYGLDHQGKIKKKINLKGIKNIEWEEITQDSSYIYLGDFGNNSKGNRQDLRILRIEKESLSLSNPVIDTIAFSYADQTTFSVQKSNTTDFDCEAFVAIKDSLYLFTKQFTNKQTAVYSLPKKPGKYTAKLKESIHIKGLVTGATVIPNRNGIVLCGYSKTLDPFVFLLYDYPNHDFSKGSQRKIKIKRPFHQIEGITTEDGLLFYISNEATQMKPFINTPQQIHTIDLSPFLKEKTAQLH